MAYALGMGAFVTGLGLITAHASGEKLRRLRRASRLVPAVANTLEALVGLYLVFYWVTNLIDPFSTTAATRAVETIQGAVNGALSTPPLLIGCALGVTVLVGFAVAAWSTRHRPALDRMRHAPDGQ